MVKRFFLTYARTSLIMLRRVLLVAAAGLLCVGCSTVHTGENIHWAQQRQQQYSIVVLPPTSWATVAQTQGFDPASLCIFVAPQNILVRSDVDIHLCLNHELGHLREYQEQLAYHSTYAR